MRRTFLATTLSLTSLAAFSGVLQADPNRTIPGVLEVAQATQPADKDQDKDKRKGKKSDQKQGQGSSGQQGKPGRGGDKDNKDNKGPPPKKADEKKRQSGADRGKESKQQKPQEKPKLPQKPPSKVETEKKSEGRGKPPQKGSSGGPNGGAPSGKGPGDAQRGKTPDGKPPQKPGSGQPPTGKKPETGNKPPQKDQSGGPSGGPGKPSKSSGDKQPPPQTGKPPSDRDARGKSPRNRQAGGPKSIDEVKRGRRQHVEEGGKRTIIEEPGNRTIVQEKGAPARIRHDEGERLSRTSRDFRRERRSDGGSLTIAIRPGGIEIYSEFDPSGRLMRRYRRDRDGRERNLIDNRRFRDEPSIILGLMPPRLHIPRERYILDYERATDDDIYDALMDGPVDQLDRGYSLDEIRYNAYLRDRMRRVDLDTVNFDFGAWEVPEDQYGRLERIAHIINRILDRNPDEVFLIEGHTDAVGSDVDNLTLSDRRAEEVAIILTETFNVPPENLVTQGYGEEFLKVPTEGPERANRRVAVRRITPLLARDR